MRLLRLRDLELRRVERSFAKVCASIEAGDFRSADVKKLHGTPYWRAKLDASNRLLLQFARHGGHTVCLALEVIENHAYEKSRFLRGATVDEAKIEAAPASSADAVPAAETAPLRWLHPSRPDFVLLDKPIVFDDAQDAVLHLLAPFVLVGSAGSGKTAVTLARMRQAEGRVLYVTQSAYLAQSAAALYGAFGYDNPAQEATFLSYREFLETLRVPHGREVGFAAFAGWLQRHRQAAREIGDVDAHALFEEFRGVVSAAASGPLDLPAYLALGSRQSLLAPSAREAAHRLFGRYCGWLREAGLFDTNLVAHDWRSLAQPHYDFIVIDEVQDLTPVQLALVLACLKAPGQFVLCGDSNQIVHPNFFSWAAVRALFWQGLAGIAARRQDVQVLQANFRNTQSVTALANALLKIKQARFGSIDRDSNFLVECASDQAGSVQLLPAREAVLKPLDAATRGSARHALIVLRDEDKAAARAHFHTPLVFSVHEAKGLEYPHVLLFGLVSGQRSAYAEVCEGVEAADLAVESLAYSRARDKSDKSLELYKFYVNALYVAMTRAVETLTLVESDTAHPLLALLGLKPAGTDAPSVAGAAVPASTKEEWAQEARRLEQQGKQEQADAIRATFLRSQPVPWTAWSQALLQGLLPRALDRSQPSAKPRQTLLDYALWHGQHVWVEQLAASGFQPALALAPGGAFGLPRERPMHAAWRQDHEQQARHSQRAAAALCQRHLLASSAAKFKDILRQCDTHGIDHRTPTGATPLMLAARAGNLALVDALLERGAHTGSEDDFGHTPWHCAVSRALEDPAFAKSALAALAERLAPPCIDVQVDGALVRIERALGEYWVLSLMLAGLKTQWSACMPRSQPRHKYAAGYFAEQLHQVLDGLPPHVWPALRHKRTYLNQVLARAETDSAYRPARKLWARTRSGHYLPNPQLLLRRGDGWQPVYDTFNLAWIELGCGSDDRYFERPAAIVQRVTMAAAPDRPS